MSVKIWTPIQEGRFHLRSMRPNETIGQYLNRAFSRNGRKERTRIADLILLALKEREQPQTK